MLPAARRVKAQVALTALPTESPSCVSARWITGAVMAPQVVPPITATASSRAPAAHSRFHNALVVCMSSSFPPISRSC